MVERWFSQITDKRIRRGVLPSVKSLINAINSYIQINNLNPKPFVWTAAVETILNKVKHANKVLETPDDFQ
jgi:hypothetical protein